MSALLRAKRAAVRLACCATLAGAPLGYAAEVPVLDFAKHPQYREVKISPDGDYLAATSRIKDKAVLSLIRLSDLKGNNVVGDFNSEIADFAWVGPHQVMYSMGEFSGHREAPFSTGELFVVDADGKHNRQLYGGAVGSTYMVADLIAALQDDPQHALISRYRYMGANSSADALTEAYRIDLERGTTTLVAKAPIAHARFIADDHGEIRIAYGDAADWRSKVYFRADAKSDWTLVFDGSTNKSTFEPLVFDHGGNNLYVVCDGAHQVGGVCRWNVATRELTTLWSGSESGPLHLVRTAGEKDVFAVVSMPDRPVVSLLDKNVPEASELSNLYRRFPGERVTLGTSTRDGGKRIVLVDSDINPGEFYLYDREKKSVTKLLARMPWIKPESMAQMEPIKLSARDGLPLHGYLTRPLGKETAKNLPLVVDVHGGPYGIRDEWGFDPEVQLLASRGYAVLQVNFRGSGGYGTEFEVAGHREWGGKMQDDVTDATRWAIQQQIADPRRICIYGASYGGYAALEGAVKEPDLYTCAIGDAGIYDLPTWAQTSDVHESKIGRSYIHDVLGKDSDELSERSPIAHLDKLKAKVLIIAGGADRRVPPAQAEKLHRALDERKVEHGWIYHVNEGHGFYDVDHRVDMYEKLLALLEQQIGAHAAAASAK